jgi:hypothetical protein
VAELVVDGLVDEKELARRAALAGAQKRGGHGGLDGLVDIGIVEHDEGPVPTHLEEQGLSGCALGDLVARLGGADEPDRVSARTGHDLVADDAPGAGDQVEHARRKLRVDDALRELDCAHRGRSGRRPDHGVSGGERRRQDLRRHRVRPVPRSHGADDPSRDAIDEDALGCVHGRWHQTVDARRVGGGHSEVLLQLADLVVRLGVERLSLVERQRAGEVVAPLGYQVSDALKRLRPLERGASGPSSPGRVGGCDSPLGVLAGSLRDGADALSRGRAGRLHRRAGLALDPLACDEHAVVHAADLMPLGPANPVGRSARTSYVPLGGRRCDDRPPTFSV